MALVNKPPDLMRKMNYKSFDAPNRCIKSFDANCIREHNILPLAFTFLIRTFELRPEFSEIFSYPYESFLCSFEKWFHSRWRSLPLVTKLTFDRMLSFLFRKCRDVPAHTQVNFLFFRQATFHEMGPSCCCWPLPAYRVVNI